MHPCPCGDPTCPGGPGKEAAGVCSGRNRASIDLLLLKPELLSGTPQSGCPCTRFLEGAVPRALTGGGTVPPKHLATALASARLGRAARAGDARLRIQPPRGREQGRDFGARHPRPLCPAVHGPASPWTSLARHSGRAPPAPPKAGRQRCGQGLGGHHPTSGSGDNEGAAALTAPFICSLKRVYWRHEVIASSLAG